MQICEKGKSTFKIHFDYLLKNYEQGTIER